VSYQLLFGHLIFVAVFSDPEMWGPSNPGKHGNEIIIVRKKVDQIGMLSFVQLPLRQMMRKH
jgi:hypothetical protein